MLRANDWGALRCIPSRRFTNVENHSYLLLIQDLNVVVLGQSVSHFQWWDEFCRDLGDDLWTCAHQAFSQHNDVSYCVQVLDCDVEMLITSEPMVSFQLSYWDDALVLRDGLDGAKKFLVCLRNEDGVLLEDGRTDVFKSSGQCFHSFVLDWRHHKVLIVKWDVGPLLLPWWHGIWGFLRKSGLLTLRSDHQHSPFRLILGWWRQRGLQEVEPVPTLLDLHLLRGRQVIAHNVDDHLFHEKETERKNKH